MRCMMCNKELIGTVCLNKHCKQEYMKCVVCNELYPISQIYSYRGKYACESHIGEVEISRENERQEIIKEEDNKTKFSKNIDIYSDDIIGKENRKILKSRIEIASKESYNLKKYEGKL